MNRTMNTDSITTTDANQSLNPKNLMSSVKSTNREYDKDRSELNQKQLFFTTGHQKYPWRVCGYISLPTTSATQIVKRITVTSPCLCWWTRDGYMIFRELVNGLLFIIIICGLLDTEAAVFGLDIFSCVMCPAQPIRIRSRPTLARLFIFIYIPTCSSMCTWPVFRYGWTRVLIK